MDTGKLKKKDSINKGGRPYDMEEEEKLDEVHDKDKKDKEERDKFIEEAGKGAFYKLLPYNKPVFLVYVALFFSITDGCGHPFFGFVFSKVMPLLVDPITDENKEDIISGTKLYAGLLACVGLLMFVSMTT
jgi:hypothetical protein